VDVVEREIDRTELYVADEVFMCGSGLEVLPITSIDRIPIGEGARGSMTKRIQDVYFAAARGENPAYRHWLTPVYAGAREPAAVPYPAAPSAGPHGSRAGPASRESLGVRPRRRSGSRRPSPLS